MVARFCGLSVFFVGGIPWVTVKGKRATSAEAPILAISPHSSYMDVLAVVFLDWTSVVCKGEVVGAPMIGSRFTHSVLETIYFVEIIYSV